MMSLAIRRKRSNDAVLKAFAGIAGGIALLWLSRSLLGELPAMRRYVRMMRM